MAAAIPAADAGHSHIAGTALAAIPHSSVSCNCFRYRTNHIVCCVPFNFARRRVKPLLRGAFFFWRCKSRNQTVLMNRYWASIDYHKNLTPDSKTKRRTPCIDTLSQHIPESSVQHRPITSQAHHHRLTTSNHQYPPQGWPHPP